MGEAVEIRAVGASDRDPLADLFAANRTLAGCGCMFFVVATKDFNTGWSGANRARLLDLAGAGSQPPMGLKVA